MANTKSEAIETLKNDIKFSEMRLEAIDAIIPVLRRFDGKKPYKNTFNPAIESVYKGLECGYYGQPGICVLLRTDFKHSDSIWPPILTCIDWRDPIDADYLIARLNDDKKEIIDIITARKKMLERIDDIVDMWNSIVSQIIELREIGEPHKGIYGDIGLWQICSRNYTLTKNDLITD